MGASFRAHFVACGRRCTRGYVVRIVLLNFAEPELDESTGRTRWWHKSGSRWPATVVDRMTDGSEYFPWPFLLSYLCSLLRVDGHTVALLDGCLRQWDLATALAAVEAERPDYVVFETSEQTELNDREVVAALGRRAPVVLIGPNIVEDRPLLDWDGVLAAVPGEYLLSVRDFFRDPFAGVTPRREVLGADMDALPFAHRDVQLFPRYNARFKSTPPGVQGQFVSMWGCQYRCKFCIWIHAYWSRSSQFKKQFSIPRLRAELDWLLRTVPGITSLYDDSDNHHYRGDAALEFAEMMGRLNRPWGILTRADTYLTKDGGIDLDIWRAYRDNGCYAIKIGVEGVQEVMDLSNKRLSESTVREFVPRMQELGMTVYCSFMVGTPGSSQRADDATLAMIEDLAAPHPDLFEYFISRCDVTRVTPFFAESAIAPDRRDGQLGIEELHRAGALAQHAAVVPPNNLELR